MAAIFGIAFTVLIIWSNVYKTNNPVCPDDFRDPQQEITAFSEWIDDFYKKNPNVTMTEMTRARVDFWRDNNCTEALKRYDDYMAGNTDENTKRLIEINIDDEARKAQIIPICPNEYDNQENYIKAAGEWLNDFYHKNPTSTKDEVLSARMDFLLENGCEDLSH